MTVRIFIFSQIKRVGLIFAAVVQLSMSANAKIFAADAFDSVGQTGHPSGHLAAKVAGLRFGLRRAHSVFLREVRVALDGSRGRPVVSGKRALMMARQQRETRFGQLRVVAAHSTSPTRPKKGVWGLGFGVWGLGFGVWEIGRAHV